MPKDVAEPNSNQNENVLTHTILYSKKQDPLIIYYYAECGHSFNDLLFNSGAYHYNCPTCKIPLKIKVRDYHLEEIVNGLLAYLDDTTLKGDINNHISSFPHIQYLDETVQKKVIKKILEILADPITNTCLQHYKINISCGHSIATTQSTKEEKCQLCRRKFQSQDNLTLNDLLKNLYDSLKPLLEAKEELELEYEEISLLLMEINTLTDKIIIINDEEDNEKENHVFYDQKCQKVNHMNDKILLFIKKNFDLLKTSDQITELITHALEYSYDNIILLCLPVISEMLLKKILIESFLKTKYFHQKNYFVFKKIFEKLKPDLKKLNYDDNHLIFYLISINEYRILEILLSVDKTLALLNNKYFEPPVIFAVKIAALDSLCVLLNAGAPANVFYNGRPAIHQAIRRNAIDILICLERFGVDINSQDQYGTTAIQLAIRFNRVEIVQYLKQLGAKLLIADQHGNNAYHIAAANPNIQFIAILLPHNSATLEDFNHNGKLPIHIAVDKKNIPVLNKILEKFPQQIISTDIDDVTTFEKIVAIDDSRLVNWVLTDVDFKIYFGGNYELIEKVFFITHKNHNTDIVSALINDGRFLLNHISGEGVIFKSIFLLQESYLETIANVFHKKMIPDYKFFLTKISNNHDSEELKEKRKLLCARFFAMIHIKLAENAVQKIKIVNLLKNHFLIQQKRLDEIIESYVSHALKFDELAANTFIFRQNGLFVSGNPDAYDVTLFKNLVLNSINAYKNAKNSTQTSVSSTKLIEGSQ